MQVVSFLRATNASLINELEFTPICFVLEKFEFLRELLGT